MEGPHITFLSIYTTPGLIKHNSKGKGIKKEHDNVLYVHSEWPGNPEQESRWLGTVLGLAEFSKMLSSSSSTVSGVKSARHRMVWIQPEPGIFVHLSVFSPSARRPEQTVSKSSHFQAPSAAYSTMPGRTWTNYDTVSEKRKDHWTFQRVPEQLEMEEWLHKGYRGFKLMHGASISYDLEELSNLVKVYWDEWIATQARLLFELSPSLAVFERSLGGITSSLQSLYLESSYQRYQELFATFYSDIKAQAGPQVFPVLLDHSTAKILFLSPELDPNQELEEEAAIWFNSLELVSLIETLHRVSKKLAAIKSTKSPLAAHLKKKRQRKQTNIVNGDLFRPPESNNYGRSTTRGKPLSMHNIYGIESRVASERKLNGASSSQGIANREGSWAFGLNSLNRYVGIPSIPGLNSIHPGSIHTPHRAFDSNSSTDNLQQSMPLQQPDPFQTTPLRSNSGLWDGIRTLGSWWPSVKKAPNPPLSFVTVMSNFIVSDQLKDNSLIVAANIPLPETTEAEANYLSDPIDVDFDTVKADNMGEATDLDLEGLREAMQGHENGFGEGAGEDKVIFGEEDVGFAPDEQFTIQAEVGEATILLSIMGDYVLALVSKSEADNQMPENWSKNLKQRSKRLLRQVTRLESAAASDEPTAPICLIQSQGLTCKSYSWNFAATMPLTRETREDLELRLGFFNAWALFAAGVKVHAVFLKTLSNRWIAAKKLKTIPRVIGAKSPSLVSTGCSTTIFAVFKENAGKDGSLIEAVDSLEKIQNKFCKDLIIE